MNTPFRKGRLSESLRCKPYFFSLSLRRDSRRGTCREPTLAPYLCETLRARVLRAEIGGPTRRSPVRVIATLKSALSAKARRCDRLLWLNSL